MIARTALYSLLIAVQATLPLALGAQAPTRFNELGQFLDSLMVTEAVPGISFAVFNDEQILYAHISGVRSRSTNEPVTPETVFEAASISKSVFAFAVYSLVLDGEIGLDTPLAEIVEVVPDVAYDARSARLTPRILLSHQGGLPNWRTRLNLEATNYSELFGVEDTLRFVSDPGTEYRYSGEGFVLLQKVIEEHTGTGIEELVKERVFEPFRMSRSTFLYDEAVRDDWSFGHNPEGEPDKWAVRVPLASSTLHTTAIDLARFGVALAGQIRGAGPYAALASDQVLVAERTGWSLHWGLGLGIVHDGGSRFVYHGGNNVIFIADFLYGVDDNLGYVLLTNSANGERMIPALERRVFGRQVRR